MNILQIANKALYPPDGGSLAILSLTKAYIKKGHHVHLLNMITHKHSNQIDLSGEIQGNLEISGIQVNTRFSLVRALLNYFFSEKPLISERFISKEFKLKLNLLLNSNSVDIVQIEGLYVLQYIHIIKKNFKGKILYRPHNIEYLIWKRNSENAASFLKKIYFKSLYRRLKKLEKRLLNTYDYLIPISKHDAKIYQELGNYKPTLAAPFGINLNTIRNQSVEINQDSKLYINYIGALDWIPNQEGIVWFVDHCLPLIIRTFPGIILNVAGRNAPQWLIKKLNHKNICFKGEIKNAHEFIQTPGPIIVPLFSGSGMRVKIIESMALKKAIVATDIAAEGIHCTHNENIVLSNNTLDFSEAIISLLNNVNLQNTIGENAFAFVKENYDYEIIASNILNFISS